MPKLTGRELLKIGGRFYETLKNKRKNQVRWVLSLLNKATSSKQRINSCLMRELSGLSSNKRLPNCKNKMNCTLNRTTNCKEISCSNYRRQELLRSCRKIIINRLGSIRQFVKGWRIGLSKLGILVSLIHCLREEKIAEGDYHPRVKNSGFLKIRRRMIIRKIFNRHKNALQWKKIKKKIANTAVTARMVKKRWSGTDQLLCLRKLAILMKRWSGTDQRLCLRKTGSQTSEVTIDHKV